MNRGWDPIFPVYDGNARHSPIDGPLSAWDGAVEFKPISD